MSPYNPFKETLFFFVLGPFGRLTTTTTGTKDLQTVGANSRRQNRVLKGLGFRGLGFRGWDLGFGVEA